MNIEDVLKVNETPQQRVERTKKFIEDLKDCQLKYYKDIVEDLNLSRSKASQLYQYFFDNGCKLYFD